MGSMVMTWSNCEGEGTSGSSLRLELMSTERSVQAFGLEQRRQQRVFIFAVAVLVVKHVGGGVWLVAADSERQADVAEIFRHEIVEGFGFFEIGVQAFGQFLSLGADVGGGCAAIFFEAGVPAANLFPGFESGELDVGAVVVGTMFLFLLVFSLSLWRRLRVRDANSTSGRCGGRWLR